MKQLRITYGIAAAFLLLTEIWIALFVHDRLIRPYVGDALVTILICCLCRTVIPNRISALPIYVFLFATFVEIAQYFNVVKLLGLQNNAFISTIVGTTFSFVDLICYGVGCLIFLAIEKTVISVSKRHHSGS